MLRDTLSLTVSFDKSCVVGLSVIAFGKCLFWNCAGGMKEGRKGKTEHLKGDKGQETRTTRFSESGLCGPGGS